MVDSTNKQARVLLVEDNEDDVMLTQKVLENSKVNIKLEVVRDGAECMRYLNKEQEYANAETPELILLDLNLPKLSGREVMKKINENEKLRSIPVVVLTTSESDTDISAMYELRCSSYIKKPIDIMEFQNTLQRLDDYWFKTVILPHYG